MAIGGIDVGPFRDVVATEAAAGCTLLELGAVPVNLVGSMKSDVACPAGDVQFVAFGTPQYRIVQRYFTTILPVDNSGDVRVDDTLVNPVTAESQFLPANTHIDDSGAGPGVNLGCWTPLGGGSGIDTIGAPVGFSKWGRITGADIRVYAIGYGVLASAGNPLDLVASGINWGSAGDFVSFENCPTIDATVTFSGAVSKQGYFNKDFLCGGSGGDNLCDFQATTKTPACSSWMSFFQPNNIYSFSQTFETQIDIPLGKAYTSLTAAELAALLQRTYIGDSSGQFFNASAVPAAPISVAQRDSTACWQVTAIQHSAACEALNRFNFSQSSAAQIQDIGNNKARLVLMYGNWKQVAATDSCFHTGWEPQWSVGEKVTLT